MSRLIQWPAQFDEERLPRPPPQESKRNCPSYQYRPVIGRQAAIARVISQAILSLAMVVVLLLQFSHNFSSRFSTDLTCVKVVLYSRSVRVEKYGQFTMAIVVIISLPSLQSFIDGRDFVCFHDSDCVFYLGFVLI